MSTIFRNLLLMDKKQEFLQNFIGAGIQTTNKSNDKWNTNKGKQKYENYVLHKTRQTTKEVVENVERGGTRGNRIEAELRAIRKKIDETLPKKKKNNENFIDSFYTDKDRAAAVSAGTYDIKQSLQIKEKQDRSEQLFIADETDINSVIALGLKEIKNSNPENALQLFTKALELHNADVNALVLRSKCYLLLGEATKALQDAESALHIEKDNIRAICQKAESLYYLGQFEKSLMYFYRGYRIRSELACFRLGIQKTKEAIENTINPKNNNKTKYKLNIKSHKMTKTELEHKNTRKLLDQMCVDKEYLEKLLHHPDLVCADTNTENISHFAKDAIEFLNKRQEFWRQQRTCNALQNYNHYAKEGLLNFF